jgi:hypothetical protein
MNAMGNQEETHVNERNGKIRNYKAQTAFGTLG